MARTLADRLTGLETDRFVGRATELAVFADLLVDDPPASVVHVHGPGGIGKSTLLRQVARMATARGWSPYVVDGRELAPVPGELESVFTLAGREERPLIILDTFERMAPMQAFLRRRLIPALPEHAVVVLAGRDAPGSEWFAGGWENVVRTIALAPLAAPEGRALVAALGIADDETATALVHWSQGSPLALSLAAAVALHQGGWDARSLAEHPALVDALVRRLALSEQDGQLGDITAVAALARVTTAAMLADVLPGVPPNEAQAWLRAQAITEPVGDGVAMHALVRTAVLAHLRVASPERERELRRRVTEHLFARAASGEPRLTVDLAELIENPALRWGFGAEGTGGLRVDGVRPNEFDELPDAVRARGAGVWWERTRALIAASPQHVVVARDADDALCGVAISFTPANASEAALADPFAGDWIRHAAEHAPEGNALVWRDALDLTSSARGDIKSRVLAVVNTAAILRSGLVNPRLFYLPISPVNPVSVAFARQAGAHHVPGLDLDVGGVRHECHVIDHGPDGMLGHQRDAIYAELGMPRPRAVRADDRAPPPRIAGEHVREALRNLDRPSALAASPLAAVVPGAAAPAAAVRALLVHAASDAFGGGPEEALLRDVMDRAYINHQSSHEQAATDLYISRTTYFRRLRQAVARVSDFVLANVTAQARVSPGSASSAPRTPPA